MYASILAYSPNTDLLNATLYEALQQQRYSLADLQCAFPCSPDSALSRVLLPSLEETGLCAKGSNLSRGEQRGGHAGHFCSVCTCVEACWRCCAGIWRAPLQTSGLQAGTWPGSSSRGTLQGPSYHTEQVRC